MNNRLCCEVNPCYVCESCHFRECQEHWIETLAKKTFHFSEDAKRCSVTNELIEAAPGYRNYPVVYYKPV